MAIYITRKSHFCAAHRYARAEWSQAKNEEVFGLCASPHGHGHNYTLEVTLKGEVDPRTGMLINLSELDAIIKERVLGPLDHKNINVDVPYFATHIPTTEELAVYIWRQIEPAVPAGTLHRVRLHEDRRIFSEYYGETA